MNVKEVENITGITRANIRFYETKKLISPRRNENGYRDYTSEDIAMLQKIRLLRLLHISIDEIKALNDGTVCLKDIMENNIIKLNEQVEQFQTSIEISEKLVQENISYRNLNGEKFINIIKESEDEKYISETLKDDVLDNDGNGWCRLFARYIDILLITIALDCIVPYSFAVWLNSYGMVMHIMWTIIFQLIIAFIIILLEPLFLMVFKATPGKFIFGLRIENENGKAMSYAEGIKRTFYAMWYGMGMNVPIIDIVRLCFSYDTYSKGDIMPWERNTMSRVNADDMNKWRILSGIITIIVLEIITGF